MRQNTAHQNAVTLRELPMPGTVQFPLTVATEHDRVVFVTNAIRRRGSLRTRAEQHRPVLAAVVR